MIAVRLSLTTIRRRPGRTFLTAMGTALGIGTIVALLAVSGGAKRSAGDLIHLGASDLGLFQQDAADPTTSVLSTRLIPKLDHTPGIAAAIPLVFLVESIKGQPGAVVFGADPGNFLTNRLVFSSGHMYRAPDQAVIGDLFAAQTNTDLGDTIRVKNRPMKVVGIYHIGVSFQDTGAFIPLKTAQRLSGRPGEATTIPVKLGVGTSQEQAKQEITARFPGISIISSPDEATRAGANGELVSKAALVIAVLALLIGGIGVMNTMLMAVIERSPEFALLSAVGWSGRQVASLVIVEGIIVSFIGAGFGLLLGTIGADLLIKVLGAQEFIAPNLSAWDFGKGLLVGILIGILGGLYPAWRAAHVSPARVLARR